MQEDHVPAERKPQLPVPWRSRVHALMKQGAQGYYDGLARAGAGSWVFTVFELLHFI